MRVFILVLTMMAWSLANACSIEVIEKGNISSQEIKKYERERIDFLADFYRKIVDQAHLVSEGVYIGKIQKSTYVYKDDEPQSIEIEVKPIRGWGERFKWVQEYEIKLTRDSCGAESYSSTVISSMPPVSWGDNLSELGDVSKYFYEVGSEHLVFTRNGEYLFSIPTAAASRLNLLPEYREEYNNSHHSQP